MSGLSHTPGKRARGKTLRGFESRPLRQKHGFTGQEKPAVFFMKAAGFCLSEARSAADQFLGHS